jgi:hypothetical protein
VPFPAQPWLGPNGHGSARDVPELAALAGNGGRDLKMMTNASRHVNGGSSLRVECRGVSPVTTSSDG